MGIWICRGRRCGASCRIIRTLGPHPRERHRAGSGAGVRERHRGRAGHGSEEEGAEDCSALSAQPSVTFVNPGSIGHPKDGSASYAVWDNGTVELRPLFR